MFTRDDIMSNIKGTTSKFSFHNKAVGSVRVTEFFQLVTHALQYIDLEHVLVKLERQRLGGGRFLFNEVLSF